MAGSRSLVPSATAVLSTPRPVAFFAAMFVSIFLFCAPARAGRLVEGISDGQVFPYRTYQAEIPFRAKVTGALKARVIDDFTEKAVAWGDWVIVRQGEAEATPRPGADEPLRTSKRDLTIPAVPIGGEFTLEFRQGDTVETYKKILVGEIWVVAGGLNALGARSGKKVDPIPWVRVFRNGRWDEGRDPVTDARGVTSRWATPWLRVAENFYQYQGIPVGLIGFAQADKTIDAFSDASGDLTNSWESQLKRHAEGAAALFWWQGEADALKHDIDGYGDRLRGVVSGVRRAVGRDDMLAVVMQLGRCTASAESDSPYFGRVRDLQRRYALADPKAILMPALPYGVTGDYQINARGVQMLGLTLGGVMREINTTGKVKWHGPKLKQCAFIDRSGFRRVRVEFEGEDEFVLDKGGEDLWLITDSKHQGYPELTGPARVVDGQVRFAIRGGSLGSLSKSDKSHQASVRIENTGYVRVVRVSLAKSDKELVLDLAEPAEIGSELHYCLMGNARSTVRSKAGGELAAFTATIEKAPEQF